MADLKDSFDILRGDLLYGQSKDRGTAIDYLCREQGNPDFMQEAADLGAWITVDNYNIPLASQMWDTDPGTLKQDIKTIRKAENAELESKSTHFTGADYTAKRNDFLKKLKQSPKFAPGLAMSATDDKLNREGWPELKNNRYYLAIRRACKFGIEHVISNTSDAQIHFVLNRFDQGSGWLDVLEKKTMHIPSRNRTTMLITYSELRYVYKNWNRFSTRVHFYRYQPSGALIPPDNIPEASSFPECDAPWNDTARQISYPEDESIGRYGSALLTHKQAWEQLYSPLKARSMKAQIEVMKAKYPARYSSHKGTIDNYTGLGDIALSAADIDNATKYYGLALFLLR